MFQIFRPQLSSVPLTYGTYLGIAHLGINAENSAAIADSLQLQSLNLNYIRYDEGKESLFFQDNSGLNWKISQADAPGAGDHGSDQAVLFDRAPVTSPDEIEPFEAHLCSHSGFLIPAELQLAQTALADRLLDPALLNDLAGLARCCSWQSCQHR